MVKILEPNIGIGNFSAVVRFLKSAHESQVAHGLGFEFSTWEIGDIYYEGGSGPRAYLTFSTTDVLAASAKRTLKDLTEFLGEKKL
jgi:hypothetical protein